MKYYCYSIWMSYIGGYAQVSYLNFERQRLPEELMKAERAKHTGIEIDRLDIEVQVCIVVQFLPVHYLCLLYLFDEPDLLRK